MMLLGRKARGRGSGPQPHDDDGASDSPPVASAGGLAGSMLATRSLNALIIACLVAGGWAGLRALAPARPFVTAGSSVTAAPDKYGERAAAGEFALRVVVAWLKASQDASDELASLTPGLQLRPLPRTGLAVSDPSVAGLSDDGKVWTVVVAATVTDGRKVTARRYFQVPVTTGLDGPTASTGNSFAALMFPAPVSAPEGVAANAASDYRVQVDPSGPVAIAVAQFLTAYVAGQGDISRYVAPGVALTAVSPAPFTSVRVVEVLAADERQPLPASPNEGQALRVFVRAVGVIGPSADGSSQELQMDYSLSLRARAGRWEIAGVDRNPMPSPSRRSAAPSVGAPDGRPSIP